MLRLASLAALASLLVLSAFIVRSLSGEPTLPETPFAYDEPLPPHLRVGPVTGLDNTPRDNPITDAGATLGRVLFYDTRLSANETVSCGSCHLQDRGFSDPVALSTGFDGGLTARNSMGLAFSRYYENGHFFWDERADTLEEQVLMPIQDDVEMGMTLDGVVARLQGTTFYAGLFEDAFGTAAITSERISLALSQFVRSIVAPGSRFDQAVAASPGTPPGQPLPGLTAQENQGMQIFNGRGDCRVCHAGPLQVGTEPRNNGLDATTTDEGAGNGRFKVGSLRNIALTGPYMHDGRFETLEEVVDFYSTGIQPHPNLDPRLRGPNGARRFNFSPQEKAALVAFLEALTDPSMATDERWSDPFANPPVTTETPTGAGAFSLALAGANPVRGNAALSLRLDASAPVRVDVLDVRGRRVATLAEGTMDAGAHPLVWNARSAAPGVYLVRAVAGVRVATQRLTVAR